jgi:hypothetical protein
MYGNDKEKIDVYPFGIVLIELMTIKGLDNANFQIGKKS